MTELEQYQQAVAEAQAIGDEIAQTFAGRATYPAAIRAYPAVEQALWAHLTDAQVPTGPSPLRVGQKPPVSRWVRETRQVQRWTKQATSLLAAAQGGTR